MPIQCVCPICGKLIIRKSSSIARAKKSYCSQACKHKGQKSPAMERFWLHVEKTGSCWLWTGNRKPNGYGNFTPKPGITVTTHRFVYEFIYGPIPHGMCVCHHCDIKHCVNPDHLFLGTHQDNMADRNAKGRQAHGDRHWTHTHPEKRLFGDHNPLRRHPERVARGERNGHAILTTVCIYLIRNLQGHLSSSTVAKQFHISSGHVQRIWNRQAWGHLP